MGILEDDLTIGKHYFFDGTKTSLRLCGFAECKVTIRANKSNLTALNASISVALITMTWFF